MNSSVYTWKSIQLRLFLQSLKGPILSYPSTIRRKLEVAGAFQNFSDLTEQNLLWDREEKVVHEAEYGPFTRIKLS